MAGLLERASTCAEDDLPAPTSQGNMQAASRLAMPDRGKDARDVPFISMRSMMSRMLALAVLAAALPALAGAQPRRGEIAGTVSDSARGPGSPLADVDVFLRGAARRTRTDSAGRYRFADLESGSYSLIARKVGYKFEEADVVVHAGASVRQDFTMTRRVLLPGVEVTARAECPLGNTITGFFCRQQRGSGTFLDYPEIDYFGYTYTGELFRHLRGFRVATRRTADGWMEPVPVRRYCTMYLVDGLVVNGWGAVPVATKDVTAMEVYVRPDTIPPEIRREMSFHSPAGLGANARDCDAVVIWTRRANR